MKNTNTVVVNVGRLMEICVRARFRSVDDVENQRWLISQALDKLPPTQSVVIAADWRWCELMTQAAANALGPMIGSFNARIERSAVIASATSPIALLQFLRVVRETNHPARRVFEDHKEMIAYLAPVLTPEERERLAIFLQA